MKTKAAFCIAAVLSIYAAMNSSCGNADPAPGENTAREVRAAPVKIRMTENEIRGFGSLSFQKKSDLAAPSDAVLETLLVREGDKIKEGEAAAKLKNPQIVLAVRRAENACSQAEAALELAKARLVQGEFQTESRLLENEKAEGELVLARSSLEEQHRKQAKEEALYAAGGLSEEAILESRFSLKSTEDRAALMEKELELRRVGLRAEDLLAAGIVPPETAPELREALITFSTEDLAAELKAAEANLEAAERELESSGLLESELTVISPISGVVGVRYFEEGERLKREDKILTVIDTESLYAVFPVSESDSLKLSKGMDASVSIDGTGGTYEGKVDLVYPQGDSQSFTFLVRVLLPRVETHLKPGMFARINVPLDTPRGTLVIPEASLAGKRENSGKVFTVQGTVLSERTVNLGRIFGDEREILSGLEKGEVVVLRPDASLKDGTYVSVTD